MSDEEIQKMPVNLFKKLVKEKTVSASINYLKMKQRKGEKGAEIIYDTLELQDYLNPCSNLSLEDQQRIFSLRTRMNPLKSNFPKNEKMKQELCVKNCLKEIDNEHLTWCEVLNSKNDYKYSNLLNGNLEEKIQTFKQIVDNEKRRRE